MTDPAEREIVCQLRSLRRIEPSRQTTQDVLQKVQNQIGLTEDARRSRWRRSIIMSSSIAAGIVVIASVAWFGFAPQRATAAETLANAAAATQAYSGWVRIHYEAEGPTTRPNVPSSSDMYVDRATGTTIDDNTAEGRREIQMWDVTNKTEVTFDSQKNLIEIGDITESFAKNWAADMIQYPITVSQTIARLKREKLEPKIEESRDDNLKRLDITFPKTAQNESAKESSRLEITRATMWIDPKTDLVQKVKSESDGETMTVTYAYGQPVHDLYDLHVARDTKVVDNRTRGDVNALFDRLQKRFEKGFGDYVAIASEMDVDHPDQPDREGAITVYAAAGEKYFQKRFLVGRKEYAPGQPRDVAIEPFRSWPPADCELVLKRVKDALPSDCFIFDGKNAWQGYGASRKDYHSTPLTGRMSQTIDSRRAQQTLPGFVWPTRVRIGLFGSDAKASLVTDPKNRPGQIGLHVEQMLFIRDMTQKQRATSTFWLDPARDDMPTEWNSATYAKDGKAIEYGSTVTFLDWRQSPAGAWYPVRWKSETTMSQDGKSVVSRQAMLLEMCPGKTLGDEWFTDPAKSLPK